MIDACGRSIDYVRISLTDRCNLRCVYCMPESGVVSLRHEEILTFEEILRVTEALSRLGIRHVRLTGGEPMARKGCLELAAQLKRIPGVERLSMTTNGLLLEGQIQRAKAAGLEAVNLSLDTLNPQDYRRITRGGDLHTALRVMEDALSAGMQVKINVVPVRELNETGLMELAALARERNISVRFIELMPVGCGAALSPIPSDEVEAMIRETFGPLSRVDTPQGSGPARYMKPAGFRGSLGLISAISHEFCERCNRVRLTADGFLKLCLNHRAGLDVRGLLRGGVSDVQLEEALREAIARKPRRHGFGQEIDDREERRMHAIGG